MADEEKLPIKEGEDHILIKYPGHPGSAIVYGVTALHNKIENVVFSIDKVKDGEWKISLIRGKVEDLLKAVRMVKGVEILQPDL